MTIDVSKIKKARVYTGTARNDLLEERLLARGPQDAFSSTRFIDRGSDTLICVRSPGMMPPAGDSPEDLKKKCEASGMPWDEAYVGRAHPVWSSDQRVNRYGDIDLQNWDFRNYNRNPIVLLSHQWDALPIGASLSHEVKSRQDGDYLGPALRQTMLFATKEMSAVADSVNRLWSAKFLRTVSVGFYAGKVIDVEDNEERAKLGLGKWGLIFDDLELVEVSPCSVPALPSAHNAAPEQAQGADIETIREIIRCEVIATPSASHWRSIDTNLRRAWKRLYPDIKVREHSDVEAPTTFEEASGDRSTNDLLEEMNKAFKSLSERVSILEKASSTETQASVSDSKKKVEEAMASIRNLK